MEKKLHAAFTRTHYRVFAASGELLLRVDRPEPALCQLLHATAAHGAALLTAFNPGGRRQPPFRNRQSQYRLARELHQQGYSWIAGRNEDPRGLWPVEPTCMVLDLGLARARQIAARYGQVAFLWVDGSATPRIIETATRLARTAATAGGAR